MMEFIAGILAGYVVALAGFIIADRNRVPNTAPRRIIPKKKMKAGVYRATNAAQVTKAFKRGMPEEDVLQ